MNDVLQDLRQSLRTFLNHPGFAVTVVATLALVIGANTAIFALVHAVLLRPVPFPDPDRLVMFSIASPQGVGVAGSPTKFNMWRKDTETFQDVSAYVFGTINLVGNLVEGNLEAANAEQLRSGHVSASFFRLFGASMTRGRTFTPEEDLPNGENVAVLSYRFWQRRFGGAGDAIGMTIPLNGQPHLIVGVLGRDFDPESLHVPFGVTEPIDVWVPLRIDPASRSQGNTLLVAGRLAPGATLAMADARLRGATTEFRSMYPEAIRPGEEFRVKPLHDVVVNDVRTPLLVLLGAAVFVLLLACANVANMALIRALGRQREMAIRAALGASRGRIIHQLMTESLVLSLLGGAIGLAVGTLFLRALLAMSPIPLPGAGIAGGIAGAGPSVGWPVVAFTFFLAMLTGLAFGLFPALRDARAGAERGRPRRDRRHGAEQGARGAGGGAGRAGAAARRGFRTPDPHVHRHAHGRRWLRCAARADAADVAHRDARVDNGGGGSAGAGRRAAARRAAWRDRRGSDLLPPARERSWLALRHRWPCAGWRLSRHGGLALRVARVLRGLRHPAAARPALRRERQGGRAAGGHHVRQRGAPVGGDRDLRPHGALGAAAHARAGNSPRARRQARCIARARRVAGKRVWPSSARSSD